MTTVSSTSGTTATAAATSTANAITALGAGSGIDVQSLATNLVEAERAPRKAVIEKKITQSESGISGYAAVKFEKCLCRHQRSKRLQRHDHACKPKLSHGCDHHCNSQYWQPLGEHHQFGQSAAQYFWQRHLWICIAFSAIEWWYCIQFNIVKRQRTYPH